MTKATQQRTAAPRGDQTAIPASTRSLAEDIARLLGIPLADALKVAESGARLDAILAT